MKGCTNEKNGTLASVHNDTLNTIHVNFFNLPCCRTVQGLFRL